MKPDAQVACGNLHRVVRLCRVLAAMVLFFPVLILLLAIVEFAEWWHFGPAQRILGLTRAIGIDWKTFKMFYNFKKAWKFIMEEI